MDAEVKRKQVSHEQLTALLEFLKGHVDLAKGLARGRRRRGKFHSVKTWNLCAKKLNGIKDGAVKDGKAWSKYWCDWKYRVRRRALELKASKEGNRPLPEGILPLSPMEETIINIIGESSVDGVIVSDPLAEESLDEDIQNFTDNNKDSAINQYSEEQPSTSGVKRRHGMDDFAGSVTLERKPSYDTPNKDFEGTSSNGRRASKRLKLRQSSNSSRVESDSNSLPETKPDITNVMESDDKAEMFLNLERQKIFEKTKVVRELEMIHSQITRLTNVMADIKDILIENYGRIRSIN